MHGTMNIKLKKASSDLLGFTSFTTERFVLFSVHLLTYLLTYLLTPWSRVLLEKLTGSAASQEIPRIFGTRGFITVLTSVRHLSLSWANSIQSSQPPPTSWRPGYQLEMAVHRAHSAEGTSDVSVWDVRSSLRRRVSSSFGWTVREYSISSQQYSLSPEHVGTIVRFRKTQNSSAGKLTRLRTERTGNRGPVLCIGKNSPPPKHPYRLLPIQPLIQLLSRGSSSDTKADVAWSWPLPSLFCRG